MQSANKTYISLDYLRFIYKLKDKEMKVLLYVMENLDVLNTITLNSGFRKSIMNALSVSQPTVSKALKGLIEKRVLNKIDTDELKEAYNVYVDNAYFIEPNLVGKGSMKIWQKNIAESEIKKEENLENNPKALTQKSEIVLFENAQLGKVRVKGNFNDPLFCLSDVCRILELDGVNKVANMVKAEFELGELNSATFDTGYGIKTLSLITEPQLYFVLMRSDKPKAKPFRQWVINEVLPSIRRSGKYEAISQIDMKAIEAQRALDLAFALVQQNQILIEQNQAFLKKAMQKPRKPYTRKAK